MLLPQSVLAAQMETGNQPAQITDVALGNGGVFAGQVVDSQGVPLAGTDVVVLRNGTAIQQAKTDANGQFSVSNLKGGIYQVVTNRSNGTYRCWASQTAPPSAVPAALVVANNEVVRGSLGNGGWFQFLGNPWVIAGGVAAAIAIPLALDDNGSSS
jgi:hypothetical protein